MQFELRPSHLPQQHSKVAAEQVKLNGLIEKIEQQKQALAAWENAKADIGQYSQMHVMPIYRALYQLYFQQMQQLWQSLNRYDFNLTARTSLEDKIQHLVMMLNRTKWLDEQQQQQVDALADYFQYATTHAQSKKANKKKQYTDHSASRVSDEASHGISQQPTEDVVEDWQQVDYSQLREQAKLKRQQDQQAQAEKLVNQSLKTVYLKIASTIHPDREPAESKKAEKTALLQRANEAYAQQDLFTLLKLQLQLDQQKTTATQGLTAEKLKYYKLALEAQSQQLHAQIDAVIEGLVWPDAVKIKLKKSKGQLNLADLYKQMDLEISALKQQLKAEKQRLMYMGKESGLEMLLEHGVL